MNLYSRDELIAMNKSLQDLTKKMAEIDKDVKAIDVDLQTEDNDANISNMKKTRMNKVLEKTELMLQIKNLKMKISAAA